MKYNIENVKEEDIRSAIKYNASFNEIKAAVKVIEIIENESFPTNDLMWNKNDICLCAYHLGVMQGKREERARRKALFNQSDKVSK